MSLKQVGIDSNNNQVLAGVFQFYDSHGLPLDIVFSLLKDQGYSISYYDFVKDAAIAGWKNETIILRLREAIIDVYGKEYWLEVEKKLKITLKF